MRSKPRRFLGYVLLATYAGISFIGDGLHDLLPDSHRHHHHGLYVVTHHDDAEPSYLNLAADGAGSASLTAADCDADSHRCEICAFLYEAISQPAEVAAPIDWQPLVVVARAIPQATYSLTDLERPAARGPPLL